MGEKSKKDSKNSKEDSEEKRKSAKTAQGQMWYRFYIEPYFDKKENKKDKTILKKCIVSYTTKDSSGVLKGGKISPDDFPILLPFLLSDSKFDLFVQNYLNIGLQHRRNFSNAQNMIRANITQLDILAGGGGGIISTTIL